MLVGADTHTHTHTQREREREREREKEREREREREFLPARASCRAAGARRHEELSGSFRRALEQRGGFDLQESVAQQRLQTRK